MFFIFLSSSLPQTVSEITLAISAISLPVLEPLSAPKLDKLCNLAMASLHCAVAQAAASACLTVSSVVSPKVCNNLILQGDSFYTSIYMIISLYYYDKVAF